MASVFLALKPKRELASRCRLVRSIEQRRELRGGLALLGDHARLAQALRADGLGLRLVPDALRLEIGVAVLRPAW